MKQDAAARTLHTAVVDVLSRAREPLTGYEMLMLLRQPPHGLYTSTREVRAVIYALGNRVQARRVGRGNVYWLVQEQEESA